MVVLKIYPTEFIVTSDSTIVRMISSFPGDEDFSQVAREVFHAGRMNSLSVVQAVNKHPGNFPQRPQKVLLLEAKWNNGENAPVYSNLGSKS